MGETALELSHAKKVRRVDGDTPCDDKPGNRRDVAADFKDLQNDLAPPRTMDCTQMGPPPDDDGTGNRANV